MWGGWEFAESWRHGGLIILFFLRLGRYLLSGYSAGKVGRDFYGFLYAVGGNDRVSVSLMGLVLFSRIR